MAILSSIFMSLKSLCTANITRNTTKAFSTLASLARSVLFPVAGLFLFLRLFCALLQLFAILYLTNNDNDLSPLVL